MKHLKLTLKSHIFLIAFFMQSFVAIAQDYTKNVKVVPIDPEVTITDKGYFTSSGKSWEYQKKIGNQIMHENLSGFTILKDISLSNLWSKINRDKNCKYFSPFVLRDSGSIFGDFQFICEIENSRTNFEFNHYTKTNFISLGRIFYTTCSNSNWEEISESLISKFSQSNGTTPIEIYRGTGRAKTITFKNESLRESLSAELVTLKETDPLNCPGTIALRLTLQIDNRVHGLNMTSRRFTEQVKRVINESNVKDSGVSVPKF